MNTAFDKRLMLSINDVHRGPKSSSECLFLAFYVLASEILSWNIVFNVFKNLIFYIQDEINLNHSSFVNLQQENAMIPIGAYEFFCLKYCFLHSRKIK